MKNKILFLVLVSLLALPNLSLAESASSTGVKEKNEVRKEERDQKREAIKNEIENKKEALKNSVEERRQNALDKIKERVDKFVKNMIERYDAAVNRLVKLADRIDSRIAKMEVEKNDVTKAKELMVVARAKIEIAKISVSDIASTTVSTSLASTTKDVLKEKFKIIKTQIEKAKEDVKVAHTALVDVVKNLKPGQNKLDEKENKIENKN